MSLRLIENASLRALNTFGVQANARLLVEVDDASALPEAISRLDGSAQSLVLGGGSNLLFTRDFDGTVLHMQTRGVRVLSEDGEGAIVEAEAGEPWDDFVRWTLDQGLYGLENLSLIPGSVGASPIQNIGAYGVEMRDCFAGLSALSLRDGTPRDFTAEACAFGYRDSLFKRSGARQWLITRVRFHLTRSTRVTTGYGEVGAALRAAGLGEAPTPRDVAEIIRSLRRAKLPDPARLGNAGSFFKNPVVREDAARALTAVHPTMPYWPSDGGVKLSAAWMIDHCGWKGVREGDAGVHAAHALVLVNHGGASGAEILALAMRIIASVRAGFGITLEPEPTIL